MSAYTYELKPNNSDSHQTNAHWLVSVVRFAYRETFDPASVTKQIGDIIVSSKESRESPASEQPLMLFDSECVSWSTSSSKGSHVSTASFSFVNVGFDFDKEVLAGDWVLLWAFDNERDYQNVKAKVKKGERANHFNEGLKFVGRITNSRRNRRVNGTGNHEVQYQVGAVGFREFDSAIHYNDMLASKYSGSYFQFAVDFAGAVNNFVLSVNTRPGEGIPAQESIPELFRILLGQGPSDNSKGIPPALVANDPKLAKVAKITQISHNNQYLMPKTIGSLLLGYDNNDTPAKPVGLTYADLVHVYVGVPAYSGGLPDNRGTFDLKVGENFYPKDYWWAHGNTFTLGRPLQGDFLSNILHFSNTTVWQILSTFLNDPLNEMYTCLKVSPEGYVVPSLVVRQTPFSSPAIEHHAPVTLYRDVPRWKLHDGLVFSDDLGTTDGQRFNYVHLPGEDSTGLDMHNRETNYTRSPPMVDEADVRRSGLLMYQKQLSANIKESHKDLETSPGRQWTKIMADILFNTHLRYNGTIQTLGIQEPVCEGDNLEYDSLLFHIQGIQHSGGISPESGTKYFRTTFSVTHGIALPEESEEPFNVYPYRAPHHHPPHHPYGPTVYTNDENKNVTKASIRPTPETTTTKATDFTHFNENVRYS